MDSLEAALNINVMITAHQDLVKNSEALHINGLIIPSQVTTVRKDSIHQPKQP